MKHVIMRLLLSESKAQFQTLCLLPVHTIHDSLFQYIIQFLTNANVSLKFRISLDYDSA